MQPILQHLFQVSDLEDVSRERLESFVEEHPSFGIAHFLLSRKLQAEGSSRFEEETQRTSLYFSNPFWLQWLLENRNGAAAVARTAEPVTAMPVAQPLITEMPVNEPLLTEAPTGHEAFSETEPGDDLGEALSAAGPETTTEDETSAAEELLRSIEEARGLRDTLHKLNDDLSVETAIAGESLEEAVATPVAEPAGVSDQKTAPTEEPIHDEQAIPEEEPIRDEEPPFVLEEPTAEEKTPAPAPEAAEQPAASREPAPEAAEQPAASCEPAPAAAEQPGAGIPSATGSPPRQEITPAATGGDILFEPYHTIDYFASQGIKFTLDENPADTLGKQLKSFTDWLKSMRRLPQKDREVIPDRIAEEAVQTIAAHSIESRDVVTETMAEVLAKQGMRERARAVYEKLSLLNPDKSAYFAAKIEQLNIP